MHMAALSNNRLKVGRRLPRVLQEEPELLSGGAVIGRESVPPVVILDQQGQQAHQLGLFRRAGPPLANQVAEPAGDLVIPRFCLDRLGQGLD